MTDTDTHANWWLDEPLWRSERMGGESLLFLRRTPDESPVARLLFPPVGSVQITSASREMVFAKGRDYVVDAAAGIVRLTADSRIAFVDHSDLFRDLDREYTIPHKQGEPGTGLYWCEGHFFHDLQAEASYGHGSTWQGYAPQYQGDLLPGTTKRVRSDASLTVVVVGDSISAGANASGRVGAAPHMPPYPDLLAEQLRRACGGPVVLTNHAVGGKRAIHGLDVVDAAIADRPDLVIIAYGMNDAGATPVDQYRATVADIMERIRAAAPQTEFILVASMLGNPQWNATPTEALFALRDALQSLCGDGVAVADMTQLWADVLQSKSYHDLTGNGVNHPNDFGHRIYAQVLGDLLLEHRP